ncbi:SRPBCC family protein [Microbacterium sp. BWT-B31]|uniref:SRPBCC family protein n=1 Tax=Microbacterium sp. BWT-B31 TaxID=3232072 RepID=UPI003528DCD3
MNLLHVHLTAETTTGATPERVWEYFSDPHAIAEYDRSVASVEITSPPPYGVGSTFDTISPPRRGGRTIRTSYRVTEVIEPERAVSELVGSSVFCRAAWEMCVEPIGEGTRVTIGVDFVAKPQFFFLAPLLRIAQRNLLATDMDVLREALERLR